MDDHTPLVESLTARETEILYLLAEDLTDQEIANRLYLALNTVKWNNRQIYGKLGIEGGRGKRDRAIARAQALGLLDAEPVVLPRNNLPAEITPFIGRETELNDLAQLLADPSIRQITILAPGGMGKTRLALQLAERELVDVSAAQFPSGVFFVPLAKLTSPDHIVSASAEATSFQFMSDGRDPKQQILDYLSNKQMLLIMDNYEHLLDGASLVTDILQAAPDVQVIATSREKLSLSGETIYTVSGMVFPDWETPEDALDYNAVKLLMQSARRAKPDFELIADDLKYVARICRLVEGMPLAIILAASWVEVLALEEVAEEIAQSIDFLAAEMRDVPRRQWSIRAVFEPTWQRLTDAEGDAFMRFSVFRGGATREAAQAVTGGNLRTLQALVNKSLIARSEERHANGHYEMHELLRQYAEEQLEISGDAYATRDAHCEYLWGSKSRSGWI